MKRAWLVGILALMLGGCQGAPPEPHAMPGEAGAKGATPAATASEAVVHEVAIRNFVYEPASLTVKVGDTIRWTNYDEAPHDAVALSGNWKTALLKQNESERLVLSEAGVFPYYCTVHPAMRGTVEVRE